MSVRVFAPAKINLTLQVGASRADGLHPLQSVVAFADVGDWVEAAPADALSLTIVGPFAEGLSNDADNLVLRAARALGEASDRKTRGAALTLTKTLPIASGIGGGSSDAAATLKALNRVWGLDLPEQALIGVAKQLGADVPVCVGAQAAYMTGIGESFAPIALAPLAAVLVNPRKPLATAEVYRRFDMLGLGRDLASAPVRSWRTRQDAIDAIVALGNDLLLPARSLLPELDDITDLLASDPRVRCTNLSGSGATVFAIVENQTDALALRDAIAAARPDCWVVAATLA